MQEAQLTLPPTQGFHPGGGQAGPSKNVFLRGGQAIEEWRLFPDLWAKGPFVLCIKYPECKGWSLCKFQRSICWDCGKRLPAHDLSGPCNFHAPPSEGGRSAPWDGAHEGGALFIAEGEAGPGPPLGTLGTDGVTVTGAYEGLRSRGGRRNLKEQSCYQPLGPWR